MALVLLIAVSCASAAAEPSLGHVSFSKSSSAWTTFEVNGREVDAFVPSCTSSKSPVVLSLHAWATNKAFQKELDRLTHPRYAGPECAVVVYAQGQSRGFLFGAVGYSWNAGGCCPKGDSDHVDDVDFLKEVITKTIWLFKAEGGVFVVGVSNGGMMANRLACSDARILAMVSVSGPLVNGTSNAKTEVFQCSRPVPVLHFHGLADPVVPFSGCNATSGGKMCRSLLQMGFGSFAPMPQVSEYIAEWRTRNTGLSTEPGFVTFRNRTASCSSWGDSASNVTLCTLEDEGHAWPGACSRISKIPYFRCTTDIDASEEAMAFIRKYLPSRAIEVIV